MKSNISTFNFTQNKCLLIKQERKSFIKSYDYFFQNLFSFYNINNNLVYLEIDIFENVFNEEKIEINPNIFEGLNNFKSLEKLNLKGLRFINNFELKIYYLKEISLSFCGKITFAENIFFNLKKLSFYDINVNRPKSLLKFPELQECYLYNKINNIIDFKSLKNLKILELNIYDFVNFTYLEKIPLEQLKINSDLDVTVETEKNMLEKIFLIKSLNKINLDLYNINNEEISNINGENINVTTLNVLWKNKNNDCNIINLQKKFPNLSKLYIYISIFNNDNNGNLEIEVNKTCKIKEIILSGYGNKNIKFYCSYEYLEKLRINLFKQINNIKDAIPIFNNKYSNEFKSLKSFEFISGNENEITLDILKNLYSNIDKIPNLKNFKLDCIINDLDNDFYQKFIKKIIFAVNHVILKINKKAYEKNEKYSENELKEIYSCENAKNHIIYKFK